MNDEIYILTWVAGVVGVIYGGILVWLIRKILGLESTHQLENGAVTTELAVLNKGLVNLEGNWAAAEQRNEKDHEKIVKKIDSHHRVIMSKFDRLETAVKNGSN